MRKFLLILLLFLPGSAGFRPDYTSRSGNLSSSSGFIDITVLSNIGSQYFQYNLKQQCLSFTENPEQGSAYISSSPYIIIPVKDFKCTNKFAYTDLLTLLKSEQYPFLDINIPDNSCIKFETKDSVILKDVSFTVAGVSRHFDITCEIDKPGNENQVLNGSARIKLTDFELVPPVKFFGLIRVNDEIIINFELCIKSARL